MLWTGRARCTACQACIDIGRGRVGRFTLVFKLTGHGIEQLTPILYVCHSVGTFKRDSRDNDLDQASYFSVGYGLGLGFLR